jgi:hypothetical protein
MALEPTRDELEAAHCWEPDDRVPGSVESTSFRRRARLHQARHRAAAGHPIGTQPFNPAGATRSRLVGSRLPLDHAQQHGTNFVTPAALDAVQRRLSQSEPHQSIDHQRLWADLLSSAALAFNLFGDLAADLKLADRAVHSWWPDAPGTVRAVRFLHSPGRLDPSFINSLVAFDVVVVLERPDAGATVIALDVKYHERMKRETPKPKNLARYLDVFERSAAFGSDAHAAVHGTELTEMWLEHLLLHSMLQHPSGAWSWGRYVVVHPAGNAGVGAACERYSSVLTDAATFDVLTLESLLASGALPRATTDAIARRYVPD